MFKRRNVDVTKSSSQGSELEALLTTNHVGQVKSYLGVAIQILLELPLSVVQVNDGNSPDFDKESFFK